MRDQIPIVLCFDSKFAPYAAVATYSVRLNSQSAIKIYWIVPSVDFDNANAFKTKLEELGLDIYILGADEDLFSEWKETQSISRGAYLRLLIPELVGERRVIYLDCDKITLGDLRGLYETQMGEYLVAGAFDPVGSSSSKMFREEGDIYINAGVLLMDLEGLRNDKFFRKCEVIYRKYKESVTWLDQCIINKYAENRKLILESKWNTQIFPNSITEDEWSELISKGKAQIVHFLGPTKPWVEWCNPCISEFWWSHANKLNIENLEPTKLSTSWQAQELSKVLKKNKRERRSIKRNLLKLINNFKAKIRL
jgi:lipopolysaccharide biosynthesis glycosyltransferase